MKFNTIFALANVRARTAIFLKFKLIFLSIPLLICIWFNETVYANQSFYHEIGRDISLNDTVIRLNFPVEGKIFNIVWTTENAKWEKSLPARKGYHAYEMRSVPSWMGKARSVAITNIRSVSGEVIKPDFLDEIDIFLAPEQLLTSTINGLYGHTLFGWSWNIVLIVLLILSTLAVYFFKRNSLAVILILGFVIAWGVMDLRTMLDHFFIVNRIEDNLSMNSAKRLEALGNNYADRIGKGTWTQKVPLNIFITYRLAERRYIPYQSLEEADFLIKQMNGRIDFFKKAKK